jgi:hypothetical protein
LSATQNWQQIASARKARRAKNRDYGTTVLVQAGIEFETMDRGWHLRILYGGQQIDFTPGSGSWSISGARGAGYGNYSGVHTLIRYMATGALPGGAA